MPELDELLRPDIAEAAARAAREPGYDAVRRRGLSRRRRTRTAVVALSAVVVTTAGVGLLSRPTGDREPGPAQPSPTPTRMEHVQQGLSAERVVDDPRSAVAQVVAVPGREEVRATIWRRCETSACATSYAAVAVTDDGFRTRHLLRLPKDAYPLLSVADEETFAVSGLTRWPFLLHADGRRTDVRPPTAEEPLAPGEVLLRGDDASGKVVPLGVDPTSGRSHRLTSPGPLLEVQQSDHRLEGLLTDGVYVSSTDGGATWERHDLSPGARALYQLVPSASPDVRAVLRGSDGATLFPLLSVDRDVDGAWDTVTPAARPRAYVDGGAVVLPGGELLLYVADWSDRHYQGGSYDRGLWVSNGTDWADLLRVLPYREVSPELSERDIRRVQQGKTTFVGLAVAQGHATTYLADGSRVYAVTGPDASTWTPVRGR